MIKFHYFNKLIIWYYYLILKFYKKNVYNIFNKYTVLYILIDNIELFHIIVDYYDYCIFNNFLKLYNI